MSGRPEFSPPGVLGVTESVEIPGQIHIHDGWVLIQDQVVIADLQNGSIKSGGAEQRYFLVWAADEPFSQNGIKACVALCQLPPFIKDLNIHFDMEPTPGFVLKSSSGFGFENRLLSEKTMEKILWELNRLKG